MKYIRVRDEDNQSVARPNNTTGEPASIVYCAYIEVESGGNL